MRIVGVIQARMGSTRLPGKVVEPIRGRPLVLWTIAAVQAIPGLDDLVVATTDRPDDDAFTDLLRGAGIRVHRGSATDVLGRVVDAVRPLRPDVVVRQTGDNPFPDPDIMAAQVTPVAKGTFDYVGIAGLPLGIGAEAVQAPVLDIAGREAVTAAEREHVLPFVYARPDRFRIGALAEPPRWRHPRYTVDTDADLAFARSLAAHLPEGERPARLGELEAIVAGHPELDAMNRGVDQRGHHEAEMAAIAAREAVEARAASGGMADRNGTTNAEER